MWHPICKLFYEKNKEIVDKLIEQEMILEGEFEEKNSRKLKYGISIEKITTGWSFGICLSHSCGETYIFINLFKIFIAIGKIYK